MNEIYRWKKYFRMRSKKLPSPPVTSHTDFLDELRDTFRNFEIVSEEKERSRKKILVKSDEEISTIKIQPQLQTHLNRVAKIKTELLHLDQEASGNLPEITDEERELLTKLISFIRGFRYQVEPTIATLREAIFAKITPQIDYIEEPEFPFTLEGTVDPEKLGDFCEKLGVFVDENQVAMILFEDSIWEISLERGTVHLKSRTVEGRAAFICLEWDRTTMFPGFSEAFTPRELLILAKIVAILTDTLPEEVKFSVERFLKEGKGASHVTPLRSDGPSPGLSLRMNIQSELRAVFRQRGLSADEQ